MVAVDAGRELVSDWRALLSAHARTWCSLERELTQRHGLGASDFEVLDRLAESGVAKWRVQELADSVHLSQSALSRLLSRLERDGLITRGMCPDDRRGIFVSLTPAGLTRHVEAVGTHRAVLARTLPPPCPPS